MLINKDFECTWLIYNQFLNKCKEEYKKHTIFILFIVNGKIKYGNLVR